MLLHEGLHRDITTVARLFHIVRSLTCVLAVGLSGTAGLSSVGLSAVGLSAERPNILFVYLDDFGWRDASYMGSDFFETPNLDAWAREAMVFSNAYSCAANCAPARACLLSGQYSPRHQVFNVGTRARGNPKFRRLLHVPGTNTLNPDLRTWAHCLQTAGYKTAIMGKWHLSDDPRPYGFDINIGGSHSGSPPRGYYPPHPRAPGLKDAPAGEYLTDRLTDEAIRFIESHREQRWCLYLSHFAVHSPFDAKRELVDKYRKKTPGKLHHHVTMATMIQAVDDGIGRLQETLRRLDLDRKTVVIFYSDNGGVGRVTDMLPLRGYKGTFYEGGIRVPLFVRWPGVVAPGTTCDDPMIGVDLYPTLCDIAEATPPANQALDGVSLVPRLRGEVPALPQRPLFWHFPAYLEAHGRSDESRDPLFRTRPCSVIRHGEWKLIEYFEDQVAELYNLRSDVGESHDLAAEQPKRRDALWEELREWQSEIGAPIPTEKNPQYDASYEPQR